MTLPSLLHIGTIRRAHGLRGQVKLALDNPDSEVLDHIDHVWLSARSGADAKADAKADAQKWSLREVRGLDGGVYLVTLDGVQDRTAAESLQLREVYAERDALPALTEDEVYQADLLGCTVVQSGGTVVGHIRAIEQMSGNFLLVVERPGREDALVPLVPAIVTDINLEARTVAIDPPEGLLELDRPSAQRD